MTAEPGTAQVQTTINGEPWTGSVPVERTVAEFVRGRLGLTATKRACQWLACGACTVLLDGRPVSSCGVLAVDLDGSELWTLEGLHEHGGERFKQLQEAFAERVAFQCGFCTSGQLVLASALVDGEEPRSPEQIRDWMSNNLCRCGSYVGIEEAVASVATGGAPGDADIGANSR